MTMPRKITPKGNDKYLLCVSCGYDELNRQILHRKTITAKSERELEKQYALFYAEVQRNEVAASGSMTLEKYYYYWKENYCIPQKHAPTTLEYNDNIFKRIKTSLGDKRISKIEPKHLLAFYKQLAKPGVKKIQQKKGSEQPPEPKTLSPNTIKKYHTLLHTLFAKAVQWKLLPVNPADSIDTPNTETKEKAIYDREQLNTFLKALKEEPADNRLMVELALACGLRRQELFGLKWEDIDADKRTIHIARALVYTPSSGIVVKSPKNKTSKRVVSYPEFIDKTLKQHKAKQVAKRLKLGDKWEGDSLGEKDNKKDFIFTQWNGKKAHPTTFYKWLSKFTTKIGLPHISPHTFRHMAASYLLLAGHDVRSVSSMLGHAQTSTTMNIYSHVIEKTHQAAAETMNTILEESSVQQTSQNEKSRPSQPA